MVHLFYTKTELNRPQRISTCMSAFTTRGPVTAAHCACCTVLQKRSALPLTRAALRPAPDSNGLRGSRVVFIGNDGKWGNMSSSLSQGLPRSTTVRRYRSFFWKTSHNDALYKMGSMYCWRIFISFSSRSLLIGQSNQTEKSNNANFGEYKLVCILYTFIPFGVGCFVRAGHRIQTVAYIFSRM